MNNQPSARDNHLNAHYITTVICTNYLRNGRHAQKIFQGGNAKWTWLN